MNYRRALAYLVLGGGAAFFLVLGVRTWTAKPHDPPPAQSSEPEPTKARALDGRHGESPADRTAQAKGIPKQSSEPESSDAQDFVDRWSKSRAAQAASDPDILVTRGLIANRRERRIDLLAESCGLSVEATMEFALVGEFSDRDYEALAFSYATPGEVARAIEFIGVPRGANVSAREQRYWPRGERVTIEVRPATNPAAPPVPLEHFVLDRRTDTKLAVQGLVYCGSARIPDPDGGEEIYLADREPPMSIVSTYNDPHTILDVPRKAAQGDVYDTFVLHPDRYLPEGALLQMTLKPEPRPDGLPRVMPIALNALPGEGDTVVFDLRADDGPEEHITDLGDLLRRLQQATQSERDPFLSLRFDDRLKLANVRDLCAALRMVEGERGIRIDAPPEGQIYFQSFLPDEKWRRREDRLTQPLELRVGPPQPQTGNHPLTLVHTLEDWSDPESLDPILTVKEYPLPDADAVAAKIRSLESKLPVLLVFAPSDAPLDAFMPVLRQVRDTHPTVYIFAE